MISRQSGSNQRVPAQTICRQAAAARVSAMDLRIIISGCGVGVKAAPPTCQPVLAPSPLCLAADRVLPCGFMPFSTRRQVSPSRHFQFLLLHLQLPECPSARLQHLQHSLDAARAHSGSDWSIARLVLVSAHQHLSTATARHSTLHLEQTPAASDPAQHQTRHDTTQRTTCSVTRPRPGALLHSPDCVSDAIDST